MSWGQKLRTKLKSTKSDFSYFILFNQHLGTNITRHHRIIYWNYFMSRVVIFLTEIRVVEVFNGFNGEINLIDRENSSVTILEPGYVKSVSH